LVATASGPAAHLWNAVTGKQRIEPLRHAELVMTARFSADGLRLLTASKDGTAQLWDVQTGLKLADPFRHEAWVISASFSPDGRRAITTSLDKTARIWDVPQASQPIPNWLPELAEAIGGRRLNADRILDPVSWAEQAAVRERLSARAEADGYTQWARP
jgi:WD40 repeat protein